ncbi:MAG: methyltransferase domain-containing protein [Chloroflexales bacterium]|nr:methyltransferase domain-containing protein [Chloroflexales bacterium]
MAETSAADNQKRQVLANFNMIAATYDGMGFVHRCAERLLEHAALAAGARVLDVATGTGLVALVAGQLVGPAGVVMGIDLSPEMLARAQHKLAASGLRNVMFQVGDAERLELAEESFDVVLCASSLFFMPNMPAAVREWLRVLAPGGRAGFSSFGPTVMQPLRELWAERMRQHGITVGWPPTQRLADPTVCRLLLHEAGFERVDVHSEQVGYHLPSAEERWREIEASLEGMPLKRLASEQRAQIKAEHFAELEALATPEGIWVDVPAHFAFGWKPA